MNTKLLLVLMNVLMFISVILQQRVILELDNTIETARRSNADLRTTIDQMDARLKKLGQ